MMKKYTVFFVFILLVLCTVLPASAQIAIDPILLNEPNEKVFGCKNDIFLEITQKEIISKVASGRTAPDYFILFAVEVLYLREESWNGIDRDSFVLRHTDADGKQTVYPLNYAISMIANLKVTWPLFSEALDFTDLRHTNLVFNVPYVLDGWSLIFRPKERGAAAPYCEIIVPLNVR
ncbi:MAG: hypothetical protein IJI41_09855 [Anaerolineaceae bacterium]|nr:hypothetical protein [Anaerolineaceae bacterium]